MKQILTLLAGAALATGTASAQQVWINEILTNPNGSDSTATFGNEHFELRGTPGMSLAGHYLLSLEGQGSAAGDINQFFDLGAFSLGASGFLFARQNLSPYAATVPGATVIQNTAGQGWGLTGASTVGHSGDGTQVDMENSATTVMLVKIGGGAAPTLTTDLDTDNNGALDLPAGWTVVDSVGIMDGASPAAGDFSYGAITFRARTNTASAYLGTALSGNVVDVPGAAPTTAGAMYVGRIGDSTGSTPADWFGAVLNGAQADALNITFASTTDPWYQGKKLPDMVFGGANPVPEPAFLSLFGLGCLGFLLCRKGRNA